MTEQPTRRRKIKKHWYFVSIDYCPQCGRSKEYRERRYGRKPKCYDQCHSYEEHWDHCDM